MMVWKDLISTILVCGTVSILAPSPNCVVFQCTQNSLKILYLSRERIASFRFRRGWSSAQTSTQTRVFLLSLWESVFLTLFKPQSKSNCVSFFPSPIDGRRFITDIRIWDPGTHVFDSIDWVMDIWLHECGYGSIGILYLKVGLINDRRLYMIIGQIWRLRNTLFRWEPIVMIGLQEISLVFDDAHVNLLVEFVQEMETTWFYLVAMILHSHSQKHIIALNIQILRCLGVVYYIVGRRAGSKKRLLSSQVSFGDLLKISRKILSKEITVKITTTLMLPVTMSKKTTESRYVRKTLVRKHWYHYVYIPELCLGTLGLQLRFAKRKFSHKMLHANRNRGKSNMKLDNNRFFYWLASKASSESIVNLPSAVFFSVYGTYICVCNNCVTIVLYNVFVVTLYN